VAHGGLVRAGQVSQDTAAGAFGFVHGQVGVVEESPVGDAEAGGGDADARGQADERRADLRRVGDDGAPGVDGDAERGVGVAVVVDDEHELVALQPGDEPHWCGTGREPVRDLGEELVAGVVAEGVVDGFEPR
jgi:hypothetical protein